MDRRIAEGVFDGRRKGFSLWRSTRNCLLHVSDDVCHYYAGVDCWSLSGAHQVRCCYAIQRTVDSGRLCTCDALDLGRWLAWRNGRSRFRWWSCRALDSGCLRLGYCGCTWPAAWLSDRVKTSSQSRDDHDWSIYAVGWLVRLQCRECTRGEW